MSKLELYRYTSLSEHALLKLVNQGNEEAKEELARRITSRIREKQLPPKEDRRKG